MSYRNNLVSTTSLKFAVYISIILIRGALFTSPLYQAVTRSEPSTKFQHSLEYTVMMLMRNVFSFEDLFIFMVQIIL